jgi:hypothetical protein
VELESATVIPFLEFLTKLFLVMLRYLVPVAAIPLPLVVISLPEMVT